MARDSALIQAVRRLEATSPRQADGLAVLVLDALKIYEEHQTLDAQARRAGLRVVSPAGAAAPPTRGARRSR
jgi:hypothetical protein